MRRERFGRCTGSPQEALRDNLQAQEILASLQEKGQGTSISTRRPGGPLSGWNNTSAGTRPGERDEVSQLPAPRRRIATAASEATLLLLSFSIGRSVSMVEESPINPRT